MLLHRAHLRAWEALDRNTPARLLLQVSRLFDQPLRHGVLVAHEVGELHVDFLLRPCCRPGEGQDSDDAYRYPLHVRSSAYVSRPYIVLSRGHSLFFTSTAFWRWQRKNAVCFLSLEVFSSPEGPNAGRQGRREAAATEERTL
jgi:hypothetical protein